MNAVLSRRKLIKAVSATALLTPLTHGTVSPELRGEGRDTPKICLEIDGGLSAGNLEEAGIRRVKQLGVDHVLLGGPRIPWEESQIRFIMARLKIGGLTLGNMMIVGFPNAIYGRPGRDEAAKMLDESTPPM